MSTDAPAPLPTSNEAPPAFALQAPVEPGDGDDLLADEAGDDAHVLTPEALAGLIEALLYAAPEALGIGDLVRLTGSGRRAVEGALEALQTRWSGDAGLRLVPVGSGWRLRTNPAYGDFVARLFPQKLHKLSRPALEVLAVIAYRQPVTRADIDDIRGVDSGPLVRLLLDRKLIRAAGRREVPGRPVLYATTPAFLDMFGLRAPADLPPLTTFADLNPESRRTLDRILGEGRAVQPEAPLTDGDGAAAG